MIKGQKIELNFLPLVNHAFKFMVYRKLYEKDVSKTKNPEYQLYKLPKTNESTDDYEQYWITFINQESGFEEFECNHDHNLYLSNEYIYWLLQEKLKRVNGLRTVEKSERIKNRRIYFDIKKFPEGSQCVWIQPYYLEIEKIFGLLIDFKFILENQAEINSRKVQQLSLSLKPDGRVNTDFYINRYQYINEFKKNIIPKLFPLENTVENLIISDSFQELKPNNLGFKKYIFKNGSENVSQFKGLKENGPLKEINKPVKVSFIYKEIGNESNKQLSYDLYNALLGKTFNSTFSGMERMFNFILDQHSVEGRALRDYSKEEYARVINEIITENTDVVTVPILITPFSKDDYSDESSEQYYSTKYLFLQNHLPSQFVSEKRLQNKEQFKWAISNIALQLYAKLGGQPWKVKPQTERCLIIGIGQSHKKNKFGQIEKYYAYSVLTDSSGLYKDIKILSDAKDIHQYLSGLKDKLLHVIEQYIEEFDDFVLHTTFSIKNNELSVISEVIKNLSKKNPKKKFTVMKFDEHNKFFGYSTNNNSLIPYESTYLKISGEEYLVWFEGLQAHNPIVRKRIGRPVYIKFIFSSKKLSLEKKQNYLQDAINLSGANWRGFNAKSLPISIYYSQLVAKYFREFQSLGLGYINLENITPWFL